MLVTLALVVFAAAIAVFFSQEFIKVFKKIFALKGAQLFLPLAVASWTVHAFEDFFLWLIYYYKVCLNTVLYWIALVIPLGDYSYPMGCILLLTAVSVVPVVVWDWVTHKRTFKWYQYPYFASTLLWLITSILLFATPK